MARKNKEKKKGGKGGTAAAAKSKDRTLRRIQVEKLPKIEMEPLPAACCISCGCDRPKEEYPPEAGRVMDVSRFFIFLYFWFVLTITRSISLCRGIS